MHLALALTALIVGVSAPEVCPSVARHIDLDVGYRLVEGRDLQSEIAVTSAAPDSPVRLRVGARGRVSFGRVIVRGVRGSIDLESRARACTPLATPGAEHDQPCRSRCGFEENP